MTQPPLPFRTISELARSIRRGDISPVELTESCLARIEAVDTTLNAFRSVLRDRAMGEARAAEAALRAGQDRGPLHGIPYAVKDLFDVAGHPTTAGTSVFDHRIAVRDAAVVRALGAAGMVLLGKTNTVQFAYGGVGINHDHGTPHNPWQAVHHVPGGSSSGSAVALASGMAPLTLGTDTGGSVRIPASLCGVTGFKTTVGRVSRAGVYPLSWSLDSVGTLTRTVEDAALVYHSIQGRDPDDETTLPVPLQDVLTPRASGVRNLRIAFAESVFWDDVDPEVERAVRDCGPVFKGLGALVDSVAFREAQEAVRLNPRGAVIAAEAYTLNRKVLEEHFDDLDPIVARRMIQGKDIPAHEYLENMREWQRLRIAACESLRDVDILLAPTTRIPAAPVAEVDMTMEGYFDYNVSYLRNTAVGNILNLCGLSLPCGFTSRSLPVGLMLYAKPYREDLLLRAGRAYQEATDWHTRIPDLSWVGTHHPNERDPGAAPQADRPQTNGGSRCTKRR